MIDGKKAKYAAKKTLGVVAIAVALKLIQDYFFPARYDFWPRFGGFMAVILVLMIYFFSQYIKDGAAE